MFSQGLSRPVVRLLLVFLLALVTTRAHAQAPPEVTGVTWCSGVKNCMQWPSAPTATRYQVVRGLPAGLPPLLTGAVDSCDRLLNPGPIASGLFENPPPGQFFWYLVTAGSACGQGPPGNATAGPRIVNVSGNCEPACSDLAIDGSETDLDCGGGICVQCSAGKACLVAGDCVSRVCLGGFCQAPACNDAVLNGNETGVDCGGSPCPPCANGQACCSNGNCQSATCAGGVCVLPPCLNGVVDANETDVDCGGGTCPPCADTLHCVFSSDCQSHVCSGGICQHPSCTDVVRNGAETDIDCGGGTCPPCANGLQCLAGSDCQSGNCTGGTCQPPLLPNGSACAANAQCQSSHCVDGVCCDIACAGLCQACSAAKKGSGTDGTCGNIGSGLDPDNECAGAAFCSGAGTCVSPIGAPCSVPTNCQSFNCVDGVCCSSACNGVCVACSAAKKGSGPDGVCGAIAAGTDPDNECSGPTTCNGSGACNLLPLGAACTAGAQCQSANCIDSVCCSSACNGVCVACSAAKKGSGTDGTCGAIAAGTDPDNECAGTLNCNGSGACGP